MSEKLNLKQIERKAWRSVFQDGLWDIYLGLLLLLMGSSLLLDQLPIGEAARLGIYLGLMAVCLVGMWLAKTYITIPRTGRAQFGPARQIRRKKVGIILACFVLLGVVVWMVASVVQGGFAEGLQWKVIFPVIYVVNTIVVFGLGAYFLDFERLYLIGVMYALPIILKEIGEEVWGIPFGYWAFAIPGLIVVVIGLVLLVRFIRENPIHAAEGA